MSRNRMRVQFQAAKNGLTLPNHTFTLGAVLGDENGVTASQLFKMIDDMLREMPTHLQARFIPSRLYGQYEAMADEVKLRITNSAANGGVPRSRGGDLKELGAEIEDRGNWTWRIDVENLEGDNLKGDTVGAGMVSKHWSPSLGKRPT